MGSTFDCLGGGLVFDLAGVREARLGEYLIAPVDDELAILDGGLQEIEQVAGVHLARVVGEIGGEPQRADHLDPLVGHELAGAGELAIAALLSGDVDDHRSRAHALHHAAQDDLWRRPGTAAVVTTASAAAMRESRTSCCLRFSSSVSSRA